jgi:hypothetical protein|tara:strand:+ start:5150 stop:5431 length:282 start_codon:yes stop_codon:yes gene_type:complete
MTACGSIEKPKDDAITKVTPTDATYAIDDLIAIGLKKNTTYNAVGLTEKTGAYYGFWGDMNSRSSMRVFIRRIQMRSSLERHSLMNAPSQSQS